MRAILIDDEKPSLTRLSRLIRLDGRIQIEGAYLSAQEGLDHLAKDKVDVVFLDIGMPEMNGLEAAQHIQQIDRFIQIVYITAYSDYALEAFNIHAIDYLLKPIDEQRFAKTLERLHTYIPRIIEPKQQKKKEKKKKKSELTICCFKRLEMVGPALAVRKFKWRTLKSQELFAYLLHCKGEWVSKQQLLETIWSDYHQDKALAHLHTSIYQSRKFLKDLGGDSKVEYALDNYRLLGESLTTDVELFERGLGEIADLNELSWPQYNEALSLYRGDYLAEHDYAWTAKKSSQLEKHYLSATLKMARYELSTSRERQALVRLLAVQDKEPYSEEICRLIMTTYAQLEEIGAMRQYYETFVKLVRTELGVDPEQATTELFMQLVRA